MAQCQVCSNARAKELNRWLLTGRQVSAVAKEFGFNVQAIRWHRRNHLPYRSRWEKKPVTVSEQLEELKYQLDRLRVLAETGEPIGVAIQAVTAKRMVLELEARLEGKLDATHKKLALASRVPEGNFRVEFTNGKAKTVAVEAGEK